MIWCVLHCMYSFEIRNYNINVIVSIEHRPLNSYYVRTVVHSLFK